MRTPVSLAACLVATAALLLPTASANAVADPDVPPIPGLETLGVDALDAYGTAVPGDDRASARAQTAPARLRLPRNFARLIARVASFEASPVRARRQLRAEVRQEGLGEFVHIGGLHGRRFTVTVISDQACVTVRPRHRGSVDNGPCTRADRRASMTPLQDSANMLLDLARDTMRYGSRNGALRELYTPLFLRWVSQLIAPRGVDVSGVVDGNGDGMDDDGRVAFHANRSSVCASLPVSANGSGRLSFGSCQRLAPRRVRIHESARAVFRDMKFGADMGARGNTRTLHQRARNAAETATIFTSHPEARAHARGDRVQFRARVNGRVRFACYRVSPDGHRATYSPSGRPGTWRLGRCP